MADKGAPSWVTNGPTQDSKAKAPATRRGFFRRHKVLTALGAFLALVVVISVIGSLGGTDAAVAAVVEQSKTTDASIHTEAATLTGAIEQAKALASQTDGAVADPASQAALLQAIESAETAAAVKPGQVTADMSLEDAKSAHNHELAVLADIKAADAPLLAAMDAANTSHAKYVADAQAAAEKAAAEKAASEKAAAEKAAADKAAAEKAAAEKAAAEKAAADKAAAEKAAAAKAATDQAASQAAQNSAGSGAADQAPSGGGSTYYANCAAVRAAG